MDLKRTWRNGFLASLIFAIPLSDLYYNQHSNLIVDSHVKEGRVKLTANCGSHTPCAGLVDDNDDGNNHEIPHATSSWNNKIDDSRLKSPGNSLAKLLFESGHTEFRNLQKTAFEFNAQDILQSEWTSDVDSDIFGFARQNDDDDFGSPAFLSYGFGNPSTHASGFSGPFMPGMFAPDGKTASADSRNASGAGPESLFVDPHPESSTLITTGASIETLSGTSNSGTGDESIHNVPEPSSFVLIMMGMISVASLLYRKSKTPKRLC